MKKTRYKLFVGLMVTVLAVLMLTVPALAAEPALDLAGERIDANTQKLYLTLKEEIAKVADGECASASFAVDGETLAEWEIKTEWTKTELGVSSIDPDAINTASELFWAQFEDCDLLLDVLLHDCAYELYWFDKTVGVQHNTPVQYSSERVEITSLNYLFAVANDYRPNGYDATAPTVDTAKTTAASAIQTRVDAIIAEYASLSDYDKLIAYRDVICESVTYNNDAASANYTGGYGDPWQIIYVFDGDPETNVVCEGYAKAFQYLCERSDFTKDVICYTVDGQMQGGTGAGGHMWNIVTMGDGSYYLVDVTNSDSGSVGENGGLFLSGYSRGISNGFAFRVGSTEISFTYDTSMLLLWGTDATSILYLSADDYDPPAVEIVLPEKLVYNGNELTVGTTGTDIVYRTSSTLTGTYEWSYTWYLGDEPMTEAPKDAGSYRLAVRAVSATDPTEVYTASATVTIEKAKPTYTIPTGLAAVYGDTLADVALPTGFSWQKPNDSAVGNVGKNTFFVIYIPADTANYAIVNTIPVEITVTRATPTYTIPTGLAAVYGDTLADVALPAGFSWQDSDGAVVGDAGKQTFYLTYTPEDPENYETVNDVAVEIDVKPLDISDAVIVLGDAPTYNGEVQTQRIESVKANGMNVTYTVKGNTATEAGTYTLTVTGTGNFTGEVTADWTVKEGPQSAPSGGTSPTVNLTDPTLLIIIGVAGGAVLLIVIVVVIAVTRKKR